MHPDLVQLFEPRYPEVISGHFGRLSAQYAKVQNWYATGKFSSSELKSLIDFFRPFYRAGIFHPQGRAASGSDRVRLEWPEAEQYYFGVPPYYPDFRLRLADGSVLRWTVAQTARRYARRLDIRPVRLTFHAASSSAEELVFHYAPVEQKLSQVKVDTAQLPALEALLADRLTAAELRKLPEYLHLFTHRGDVTGFVPKNLKQYFQERIPAFVFREIQAARTLNIPFDTTVFLTAAERLFDILDVTARLTADAFFRASAQPSGYLITREKLKACLPTESYAAVQTFCSTDTAQMQHDAQLYGEAEHPRVPLNTERLPGKLQATVHKYLAAHTNQLTGRLIHGDNLAAMRTLHERGVRVQAAYTDPPYNTGGNLFPYKDGFASGAWLSLMQDRLFALRELLNDRPLAISIGEEEVHHLKLLLQAVFGRTPINSLAVRRQDKNLTLQFVEKGLSSLAVGFEYVLCTVAGKQHRVNAVYQAKESSKRTREGYWKGFWNGADRPTMRYPLLGAAIDVGQWKWKRETGEGAAENYLTYLAEHADRQSLAEYWRATGESLRFVRKNPKGAGKHQGIEHWVPPAEDKLRNSNWTDQLVMRSVNQTLGLEFPSPKNPDLIAEILHFIGLPVDGWCLDCFAGSGSTYDAVQRLNARDGGKRRTILIERSDSFDRFLLERVSQLSFSADWKKGAPQNADGPGVFAEIYRFAPVT